MGAILAKFRKEKTTYQILESLEDEIKDIEEYSLSTQLRQKRYVGRFLVISIGLYIIGFIVFYFLFFPPTWTERMTYSIPLLIFPMLIFFLKRLVAWYFQRKLNKNSNKLKTLRDEKKKTIERVMEKETYKVALEILNRFGDKSNGFKATSTGSALTPRITATSASPLSVTPLSAKPIITPQKPLTVTSSSLQALSRQTTPIRIAPGVTAGFSSPAAQLRSNLPPTPMTGVGGALTPRLSGHVLHKKRTPYPIINQHSKGVLEKMVDYLIGDGPHNRFAMICKECFAHNGMALQEEYEYAAFRCAFCHAMNPSRKSRPIAPKLPTFTPTHAIGSSDERKKSNSSSSSTSTSEKDSGSDSDDKQIKRSTNRKDPEPPLQLRERHHQHTEESSETTAASAVNDNGEEPVTLEATERLETDKKND